MRRRKQEKTKLTGMICMLFLLVLGIGYAILTEQLQLESTVNYGAMAWDIGFTTAEDGGGSVESSPSVSADKKSVTITCNIGTTASSETCIAKAKIKNGSSFVVELENDPLVTSNDTYIKSVNAIWTWNNQDIEAGDKISSNKEKEIQIIITTKELTEAMLPSTTLSIPITITLNWMQEEQISFAEETALFIGDSVAYGYATNGNGFGYYIDQSVGLKSYTNAAVNSATINTQTQGTNNIIEQMKSHKDEVYDYVIIEGGFGDLRDEPTLGSLTTTYNPNEFDTTTFAGAVEYSLYLATTYWENSKIGFIISYYTPNSAQGIREDYDASKVYWDVVKAACDKWNVKYLDFFSGSAEHNDEIKTYNEIFDVENTTYITDGVHPNENGYKVIVPFIIEWMNKLSTYEKDFDIAVEEDANGNKIVTSFSQLVYTADYAIGSTGSYGISAGRAASVGYYIKVNGGETIGLSSSATGVSYALYEFNDSMSSSGGEIHTQWLNENITLNANTKYVAISFKNGDGSTSFTAEQLALLPNYLEFK